MISIVQLSELDCEAKATQQSRLLTPLPGLPPSPMLSPSCRPLPTPPLPSRRHTHTYTHTCPAPRFVCIGDRTIQHPGSVFQFSLPRADIYPFAFHNHPRGMWPFPQELFPCLFVCVPIWSQLLSNSKEKHSCALTAGDGGDRRSQGLPTGAQESGHWPPLARLWACHQTGIWQQWVCLELGFSMWVLDLSAGKMSQDAPR